MGFAFTQVPGVFPVVQVNYYTATAYPSNLGSSITTLLQANSSTASTTMMFRNLTTGNIMIDQSYVLGTAVTGTLTWNNKRCPRAFLLFAGCSWVGRANCLEPEAKGEFG